MERVVNYYEHEDTKIRLERSNKRLFILCLIMFLAFVGSNAYWIYTENQYEDVSTTVTQELNSSGGNAIINDGVHFDGENKTDGNN